VKRRFYNAQSEDGVSSPATHSMRHPCSDSSVRFCWSPYYRPEFDSQPDGYLACGLVGWSRSRRLVKVEDPNRAFKAYLGVHHTDPARWQLAGEPEARFFVSLFVEGRTVALSTFDNMSAALSAVCAFHASLQLR
jgi:hypothetical protein